MSEELHISEDARKRFSLGDKVVPTEKAFTAGLWQKARRGKVSGVVTGFSHSPWGVSVLLDGQSKRSRKGRGQRYHMDFWQLAATECNPLPSQEPVADGEGGA